MTQNNRFEIRVKIGCDLVGLRVVDIVKLAIKYEFRMEKSLCYNLNG